MYNHAELWNTIISNLQAFNVLLWVLTFAFGALTSLCICTYVLFFTKYWWLLLCYFLWIYIDKDTPRRGGRRSEILRTSPMWNFFIDYFPVNLVKTADLDENKNYLFISHPHGMLNLSILSNFANNCSTYRKLLGNFKVNAATLDFNFKIPFFREYFLGLGAVSVSKESLLYLLDSSKNKGNIVIVTVGGAAETYHAKPRNNRIILKERKGFVKIALRAGAPIVPVFGFGEVDLYEQVESKPGSRLEKFQKWFIKATGVAFVLPKGQGFCNFLPFRKTLTTVVGEPIEIPLIPNPTDEVIEQYHSLYIKRLTELFYTHRSKYIKDYENVDLIID